MEVNPLLIRERSSSSHLNQQSTIHSQTKANCEIEEIMHTTKCSKHNALMVDVVSGYCVSRFSGSSSSTERLPKRQVAQRRTDLHC